MKQETALDILKTGISAFLTGEPGSGKTYTINRYIEYLREHGVDPAVTASTGIGATHIGGYTIHSWSGVGIRNEMNDYELEGLLEKKQLYTRIKPASVLIIDEISMLDGKVFDLVDKVIRAVKQVDRPFGGMQVICVGDFFQLPPVSNGGMTFFAFETDAWKNLKPATCYLSEQFRQSDSALLDILSAIRKRTLTDEHHTTLSSRAVYSEGEVLESTTKLFSHNIDVDRLNSEELEKLTESPKTYPMATKGRAKLVEQLKRGCLSPENLVLKKGAVVMCTKNNFERGFVNGTLGKVTSFESKTGHPIIRTTDGRELTIPPMEWGLEEDGKVLAEISQIPLRLAWAITVHKSQGMSLDSALIDLSKAFEYGQGYVALSRVRTLDGLFCSGYNERALEVHPQIYERDRWFMKHSSAVKKQFEALDTKKKEEMTAAFLEKIGGSKKKGEKKKKESLSTHDRTLELLREKRSLADAAKERGMVVSTIFTHLEVLRGQGKIQPRDVAYLWNGFGKGERELREAQEALDACESEKLRPAYDHLSGRFTFDELRLARILMESKS